MASSTIGASHRSPKKYVIWPWRRAPPRWGHDEDLTTRVDANAIRKLIRLYLNDRNAVQVNKNGGVSSDSDRSRWYSPPTSVLTPRYVEAG
jgi:hypothetical protein